MIKRTLIFIFSIYGLMVFLGIMLMLFPFVIVASFFGKIRGGNIIYNICRLWADVFLIFIGIRHRNMYESPHDPGKPYIFLSNHISYMDIPVMMKSIRKQPFRILGKAEMSRIPIFGYIYKSAVVMVDRENAAARVRSVRILTSVIRKGISVFICPEGTFNTTDQPLKSFYDGAFRIAIETKTPIKPLLFLDTYDRLNYKSVFSLTPGKSRTVFLKEIPVDGYTLADVKMLKDHVYGVMEEGLRRYGVGWVG